MSGAAATPATDRRGPRRKSIDRAGRAGVCVVLLAGPTALAFFSGGYFGDARTVAGVVAWVLVATAAVTLEGPLLPSSRPARLALVGLALLAAWVAISQGRAPLEAAGRDDLERDLLYLAALLAAVLAFRDRAWARAVEPALALGALLVIGYALSERLLPDLVELDRSVTAQGRLEQPLTYWNAMGAAAALGLVLCIRLAGDRSRGRALRIGAVSAAVPIGLGLYLSFSRGALAAAAVGLIALVAIVPERAQVRAAVIALGAAVLSGLVASRLPGVESLAGDPTARRGDGLMMLAALAMLAGAAALVQARLLRRPAGEGRRFAIPARAVLIVLGCVVLAAPVAAGAVRGESQLDAELPSTGAGRLGEAGSNRYGYWRVALESFGERPLAGVGPSGFDVEWARERRIRESVHEAHSLPLETLAELGLVGAAALALLVAGVALAAGSTLARDRALGAGLAAALFVWAAHASVDWDWEMPAVSLVAVVLAGALMARAGRPASD